MCNVIPDELHLLNQLDKVVSLKHLKEKFETSSFKFLPQSTWYLNNNTLCIQSNFFEINTSIPKVLLKMEIDDLTFEGFYCGI